MATYTARKVASVRHEWIVPSSAPWGAAAEEIGKAWAVAEKTYREVNNIPDGASIAGDALAFHGSDDAVTITFTTEAPIEVAP
jgi:hypothetical protein